MGAYPDPAVHQAQLPLQRPGHSGISGRSRSQRCRHLLSKHMLHTDPGFNSLLGCDVMVLDVTGHTSQQLDLCQVGGHGAPAGGCALGPHSDEASQHGFCQVPGSMCPHLWKHVTNVRI
jgi:hypothetical protein